MTSDNTRWRKASRSGSQGGNCIEVADHPDGSRVLVRDTKDRTGPMLRFAPEVWRSFTGQVKGARSLGAVLRRGVGLRKVGATPTPRVPLPRFQRLLCLPYVPAGMSSPLQVSERVRGLDREPAGTALAPRRREPWSLLAQARVVSWPLTAMLSGAGVAISITDSI